VTGGSKKGGSISKQLLPPVNYFFGRSALREMAATTSNRFIRKNIFFKVIKAGF
jgi:hypothetical protein